MTDGSIRGAGDRGCWRACRHLDAACKDNPALCREVEELLSAHDASDPLDRLPEARRRRARPAEAEARAVREMG